MNELLSPLLIGKTIKGVSARNTSTQSKPESMMNASWQIPSLISCILLILSGPSTRASESAVETIQTMLQGREFEAIITTFGGEDFSDWTDPKEAVKAFTARSRAYAATGDLQRAENDLRKALSLRGNPPETLLQLAEILERRGDTKGAFDAYEEAYEIAARNSLEVPTGWLPISATLGAAAILRDRGDYGGALELLSRYLPGGSLERAAPIWQARLLRAYGQIYLGQGEEAAARESFRQALEAEAS